MRKRNFAFAAALIMAASAVQFGQTNEAPRYLTPPKEIVAAFDVPPLPAAILSPSRQVIALTFAPALSHNCRTRASYVAPGRGSG